MNKYLIMPQSGYWFEVEATSHLIAYMKNSCWFSPKQKVAVMDKSTNITRIYQRQLDENGNLIRITKD